MGTSLLEPHDLLSRQQCQPEHSFSPSLSPWPLRGFLSLPEKPLLRYNSFHKEDKLVTARWNSSLLLLLLKTTKKIFFASSLLNHKVKIDVFPIQKRGTFLLKVKLISSPLIEVSDLSPTLSKKWRVQSQVQHPEKWGIGNILLMMLP